MKYFFVILLFIINIFSCTQKNDNKAAYFCALNNLKNYSTTGYLEVIDNKIVFREPLTIGFEAFFVIRPFDVFIKVYNVETKEEYYTRNFLYRYYNNYMYVGYEPLFVLNLNMVDEINDIRIENRNDRCYMELYQSDTFDIELDEKFNECSGVTRPIIKNKNGNKKLEFEIKFYRPKGKIISNVNNIFFQFESVEETKGNLIWGKYDLSNIDVLEQIQIMKDFFTSSEKRFSDYENDYYITLLDNAEYNIIKSKDEELFLYTDPFNIKPIFELFP